MCVRSKAQGRPTIRLAIRSWPENERKTVVVLMRISRRSRSEETRSVRDEGGYNQGWTGGLSTRIREERRCELLMTKMSPDPAGRVLEIGCGRGEIARHLAAKSG